MTAIIELQPGKFEARWPVVTVQLPGGHFWSGRPASMPKVGKIVGRGEAVKIGTLAECEKQR